MLYRDKTSFESNKFLSHFLCRIKGRVRLTQEWITKTLVSLGLPQIDVEIYVFLSTQGPQKGRNIANKLKLHRQELYRSLNRLKTRGIVIPSVEHPAVFSSLPFEKVLDLFLEVKREQADVLQESKQALLSSWRGLIKKDRIAQQEKDSQN